jgi:hypothetical protein
VVLVPADLTRNGNSRGDETRTSAESLLNLTSGDGGDEELALILVRSASVEVLHHQGILGGVEGGNLMAVLDARISEGIGAKGLLQEVLNNTRETTDISDEVGSVASVITIVGVGNPEGRVHARGDLVGLTPLNGREARVKRPLNGSVRPVSASSIAIANRHVDKLTTEEERVENLLDAGVRTPEAGELRDLDGVGELETIRTVVGVVFPFSVATTKRRGHFLTEL